MKKSMVIAMILLLLVQLFSGTAVFAAIADNIVVEGYSISTSYATPLKAGNTCTIVLKCTNRSASDLQNVYASIDDSSSFYGNPSSSVKVDDSVSGSAIGVMLDNGINLVYKGTGHELNLTLSYTISGSDYTETESVYISQVEPTSTTTTTTPLDTTKYVPKLGTTSGNTIPTITAGTAIDITYSVKNSSIYQARNITTTLKMTDETKAPLVLNNLDLRQTVDQIDGAASKDITFSVEVLKKAPAGLYMMKLSYDLANAYGDTFQQSETVYIRVKNDSQAPKLTVDAVSAKKDGTAVDLEMKIKNIGTELAKDIKFTLRGLKSGGFTTGATDIQYLKQIVGGGTGTVTYKLQLPQDTSAMSNELVLKFDYTDDSATVFSDENQIFVPVDLGKPKSEIAKPSIEFANIISPQEALKANQDFEVRLELKNTGAGTANNVKVTLVSDKEIVTKSLSPVYMDKLDTGTSKSAVFLLFATDDAVTKNYPLAVNVDYEDTAGTKYAATQYVGAYVENGISKTVPRVIIDRYSIDPATVQAASDFKVTMSFLNTSKTNDISNIKVTVTSDDGTFTPTDSGNTFFIDTIPHKSRVEKELSLHVKPDAEQKSYVLSVNFEYEDDKGNSYATKETMSVRVLQNPRLVTGELSLPAEAYAGQPVSIYVDYYNMGKSPLYNMMVKAEGNFQGQNLSYYVGNFESGRTDSYEATITPTSAGALNGSIVFSFEDANGKVTEVRKDFTFNVMEMMQPQPGLDGNGMPVDDGKGTQASGVQALLQNKPLVAGVAGVLVLVVGVILVILVRKRKARRKEMELDE